MAGEEVVSRLYRQFALRKGFGEASTEVFARLVDEAPIANLGGFWVVSRNDLVRHLSNHPACVMAPPEFPAQAQQANPGFVEFFRGSLSLRPPSEHKRLRAALTKEFSSRAIVRLRARLTQIVDDLFAGPLAQGSCEFVSQIAVPLPVLATAALLDLPEQDWPQITDWAEGLLAHINQSFPSGDHVRDASPISAAEFERLRGHVDGVVRQRDNGAGTDLISRLNRVKASGQLSHDEVVDMVLLLFMTGVDTVTSALANAVVCLLRRPREWQRVLDDPDLATTAFTESIRLLTPVAFGARVVTSDIDEGDIRLRAGDRLLLGFAAANLDPRQFHQPLEFHWDRPPAGNVSFGHGSYYCIGAGLGTIEAEIVLRKLAQCGAALAPDPMSVRWRESFAFNSPGRLDLLLGAHHRAADSNLSRVPQ